MARTGDPPGTAARLCHQLVEASATPRLERTTYLPLSQGYDTWDKLTLNRPAPNLAGGAPDV